MEQFDISTFSPEVIIFGGLTLMGLALISLVYRQTKFYGNHTNDVINRNTDAWIKNSASSQRQADALDRLTDVIEKFHERI